MPKKTLNVVLADDNYATLIATVEEGRTIFSKYSLKRRRSDLQIGWFGILFVGSISATGTLVVLDWRPPGRLMKGSGNLRYAQTMAFTTMVFFSVFTVFNARSDE